MSKTRVVVTGIAVCAPNGVGAKQFEKNILNGVSGCRNIESFEVPNDCSDVAGIANDFMPETLFSMDNATHFSNIEEGRLYLLSEYCIDEALRNANLISDKKHQNEPDKKISLSLATAIGPMASMEYNYIQKDKKFNSQRISPAFSFGNFARQLSNRFGLLGSRVILPTGCVGGCDAVSYAVNAIREGRESCVIAGAVEAPITPLVVSAFGKINATSSRECKPNEASCPFDSRRDGFVLAEGCGILILESEESALKRKAPILAEIKGNASVNNCFHMTDISSEGNYIEKSCRLALNDAELSVDSIDYINAHGSSTPQNDLAESKAFNQLLGNKIDSVPVTSIKSQIGHALSAANAIELVSAVQTLKHQKVPPTINQIDQDNNCHINIVKNKFIQHKVNNILKTSSGFSGIHTAVVLGQYE